MKKSNDNYHNKIQSQTLKLKLFIISSYKILYNIGMHKIHTHSFYY